MFIHFDTYYVVRKKKTHPEQKHLVAFTVKVATVGWPGTNMVEKPCKVQESLAVCGVPIHRPRFHFNSIVYNLPNGRDYNK